MNAQLKTMSHTQPIGFFDSGVGGLSLWQQVRTLLPNESTVYVADSLHAPYGNKSTAFLIERCSDICAFLLTQNVKVIVVACNTATVHVINILRSKFDVPFIGIEPAIKPAVNHQASQVVGVLATEQTVKSHRLDTLIKDNQCPHTQVILQPCAGLADRIECGNLNARDILTLIEHYLSPLIEQELDTLVLACTHYPFILEQIKLILSTLTDRDIEIIEPSIAVIKQLERVLQRHELIDDLSISPCEITSSHVIYSSAELDQAKKGIFELLSNSSCVKNLSIRAF